MTSDFERRLKAVDQPTLTPLVRRALEDDSADVIDWGFQPLSFDLGHSYGIYRFQGTAKIKDEVVPWSMVLKATGAAFGSPDPRRWNYWKREMLAYQSGLLEDLPGGLSAPRCYGTAEYPGDECWMWIEDLADEGDSWPLERYGLAARHLGQFNGAYLAGRPLPDAPWLSRGRVWDWLEESEASLRSLNSLAGHPLVRLWFEGDSLERTLQLWENRASLLAALDRLPRTLCHHDAFRRNLTVRTGPDGEAKTTALDWAIMGMGAVGEEIATLTGISLRYLEVGGSQAAALGERVFEGYLEGLRYASWDGPAHLARFGYAASAALYIGVADAGLTLEWALSDGAEEESLAESGHSLAYLCEHQAPVQRYLLDLGDDALSLCATL